jgi:hypothetical protein
MSETKQQRWNKKNPEKLKIARERSSAKHFIKNYATEDEANELQALLQKRLDELENKHELKAQVRRERLAPVQAVIRRHSGPDAITVWRWGDDPVFASVSDVQSAAEHIYPYIYKGQYYAVALFDDSVCVGLPQYARFHPGVEESLGQPMPWYYNKVYRRKDWPKVRTLLQTKYDFHEVVRVRYAIDAFVEKVGNEYFYPISGWPMVTVDPDDANKVEFDLKTKTRFVTRSYLHRVPASLNPFAQPDDRQVYLESTIDQAVFDRLTPEQKLAFVPITDKTDYAGMSSPLQERIGEDDLPRINNRTE